MESRTQPRAVLPIGHRLFRKEEDLEKQKLMQCTAG